MNSNRSREPRVETGRSIRVGIQIATIALLAAFALAGCSSESVRADVAASRARAYRTWADARRGAEIAAARLEGDLSLADAVKVALAHNPSLRATMKERGIATGQVIEARAGVLPRLDARATYTRLDEVPGFDVGGESISLGYEDTYAASLKVTQPLYRGGRATAAIRAAAVYTALTDETVRAAVQETVYATAAAYYEALLGRHLLEANRETWRSAVAHLEVARLRRDERAASDFEVLRAEVEAASYHAEMMMQESRNRLAMATLLKVLGASQESVVVLTDELAYAPLAAEFEEAVRAAFENHPALHRAELSIRLQNEALRAASSDYQPRADAFFSWDWARPDPHLSTIDEWGDAWSAGISIDWPIFDGLGRNGRIAKERATLAQRRIELTDAEQRIVFDVRRAILGIEDAGRLVESQKLNLDRAERALDLANKGFAQGVTGEIEVTDARAALARARSLYYRAVYDHMCARLNLERATGHLGPDREAVEGGETPPAIDREEDDK